MKRQTSPTSRVPQRVITLLEMRAADRIDYQIHATAIRELHQLRLPVLLAIINRGLDHAIDYRKQDWQPQLMQLTDGRGVDLIIDRVVQPALTEKLMLAGTRRAVSHS